MKGSIIIVSFFIAGVILGTFKIVPPEFSNLELSYFALCALMFCVGVSIGKDPNALQNFKSLNPGVIFLPLMTIIGTLAGAAVISLDRKSVV